MRDKARIRKVELTHGHGLGANAEASSFVSFSHQSLKDQLLLLPAAWDRTQGSGVMGLATLPAVVCLWLLCFPVICGNWWWQRFCPTANADFWVSFPFFPGQVEELQQHDCFTHGQFDWLTAGTLVQEPVIFQFWQATLCTEIVLQIKWNYYFL